MVMSASSTGREGRDLTAQAFPDLLADGFLARAGRPRVDLGRYPVIPDPLPTCRGVGPGPWGSRRGGEHSSFWVSVYWGW